MAVAVHPCGIPEFREIWEFWEEMWLSRHTSCGCGCTPLWNSGIPGNMGILGRDVISLHWALWNSGIPGNMGILGRDVTSLHWALWNSGIPGIMGRDVMLTHPLPQDG